MSLRILSKSLRYTQIFQPKQSNQMNTSRKLSAQEIHEKSIRDGRAEIILKFGSKVAQARFGIASDRHVPSPAERIDLAVNRGVNRAFSKLKGTAKPSTPKPVAKTSTSKSFAARGPNWSVKRFCVPFSR